MERIALYARVSTTDKGQDPEVQLRELREWGARLGGDVVGVYVDHASGSKADRAQLQAMLRDAHERRFDTLLVWALDRLSREGIGAMLGYVERLKASGVRVRSLRDSWLDTDAPTTPLLISVLAWCAQQERERIRERVRAGVAKARKHGTKSGKAIGRPVALTGALELAALRHRGFSVADCARELGVSKSTVKRKMRENPGLFS